MSLPLTEGLCVSDEARDAALLHVSASSGGQECGNETWLMKNRTYTNSGTCEPTGATFKHSYD
jgi:hypothetical protein